MPALDQWKDVAELELRFMETLSNCRLRESQAAMNLAQAEFQRTKTAELAAIVREKQLTVKQYELELTRLNRTRHIYDEQIHIVESRASWVSQYQQGERLSPESAARVWTGFNFFLARLPATTVSIFANMLVTDASRTSDNFTKTGHREEPQAVPDTIKNVLQLVNWMVAERVIPKLGSMAYFIFNDAVGVLLSVAVARINELRAREKEIEAGTYNIWKPLELLVIPTISVAKISSLHHCD
jgi:hypothetical protein